MSAIEVWKERFWFASERAGSESGVICALAVKDEEFSSSVWSVWRWLKNVCTRLALEFNGRHTTGSCDLERWVRGSSTDDQKILPALPLK